MCGNRYGGCRMTNSAAWPAGLPPDGVKERSDRLNFFFAPRPSPLVIGFGHARKYKNDALPGKPDQGR